MNRQQLLASLNEEISRLEQIRALIGGEPSLPPRAKKASAKTTPAAPRKRGTMSAEGRARVAEAQRARWAKLKRGAKKAKPSAAVTRAKT